MADQCIVCLENLDAQPPIVPALPPRDGISLDLESVLPTTTSSTTSSADLPLEAETTLGKPAAINLAEREENAPTHPDPATQDVDEDSKVAEIEVCGHMLHDTCLRAWTVKANSCPICRQAFHSVNVYDRVGGTKIDTYTVEDKKQVAEFDAQAWLAEHPEDEDEQPARPCPICERSDHEEVLLLCDGCDAPYHTYCVGLDSVPRGHWFCLECSEEAVEALAADGEDPNAFGLGLAGFTGRRSDYLPRTRATMRRARRRARSDEWQGAWGQITTHVFDALNLDLDNHDDDEALQDYRRSQQHRMRDRQIHQRWQQRLNIASRLGAPEFANHLPEVIPQPTRQQPPPPQESPEEKRAWGVFERAMETNGSSGSKTPNARKRKSRSVSASPREPAPEPERKLKRPRTRRVPHQAEASSAGPAAQATSSTSQNGLSSHNVSSSQAPPSLGPGGAPSFLSSLLKEVEMSSGSDDENIRAILENPRNGMVDASSPAASPSHSGYSSPRALSATPPPRGVNERPGSPLSLMSRIEPIYPPANFSPTRNGSSPTHNGSDHSDGESKGRRQSAHINGAGSKSPEIRQPRPRRQNPIKITTDTALARSPESSPTRGPLSLETKESISNIIKSALRPFYKAGSITADQYTSINRDLSRRLYQEMSPDEALDDDARQRCEKMATKEVARAVTELNEVQT